MRNKNHIVEEIFQSDPRKKILRINKKYIWDCKNSVADGAHGVVYRAWRVGDESQSPLAIKVVKLRELGSTLSSHVPLPNMDDEVLVSAEHEAKIVASMYHENICKMYDSGFMQDSENNTSFYMVMEWCGADLFETLSTQSEPVDDRCAMLNLAKPILQGLDYLHTRQEPIAHRDIKLENITLGDNGSVKIVDFGMARIVCPELTEPGVVVPGTGEYIAPELIQRHRGQLVDVDVCKADIWALGILMWAVLTHRNPTEMYEHIAAMPKHERPDMRENHYLHYPWGDEFPWHLAREDDQMSNSFLIYKTNPEQYKGFNHLSEKTTRILKAMLCLDVRKRVSAREAIELIEHVYETPDYVTKNAGMIDSQRHSVDINISELIIPVGDSPINVFLYPTVPHETMSTSQSSPITQTRKKNRTPVKSTSPGLRKKGKKRSNATTRRTPSAVRNRAKSAQLSRSSSTSQEFGYARKRQYSKTSSPASVKRVKASGPVLTRHCDNLLEEGARVVVALHRIMENQSRLIGVSDTTSLRPGSAAMCVDIYSPKHKRRAEAGR
eukprot:CFRG6211T1